MKCRFYLFLLLTVFVAQIDATPLKSVWIESAESCRFSSIKELPVGDYQDQLTPYLFARGVESREEVAYFFYQDLSHIAHSLSILFEQDARITVEEMFSDHIEIIPSSALEIDHVGRELYGPLSTYISIIKQIASQEGLVFVKALVFPSTQVVKTLRESDPHIAGVTIARIYLLDGCSGQTKSLELFQASPQDEKSPQSIEATQKRISLLSDTDNDSSLVPIDHLAIQVSSVEEVCTIHNRIQQFVSNTLRPCCQEICYNPGDGSVQTKVMMRTSEYTPFNRVVEFVSYTP